MICCILMMLQCRSDAMYRSQIQQSQDTERLIRLNAIRSQLIMGIASAWSGLTMSDAMDLLLNSILLGITSSDLLKLNALIEEWNDIKPQRKDPQIEEKKEEEYGVDLQNAVKQEQDDNEMAVWFRQTLKLPQYLELFESEGFDELEMLSDLNDALLKELGINKMGHRMRILKAIKKLNAQTSENGDDTDASQEAEGAPPVIEGMNVIDTLR